MLHAVLNFHVFPSSVIFFYRLFISCQELYLVRGTEGLHVVRVLPGCCWRSVIAGMATSGVRGAGALM